MEVMKRLLRIPTAPLHACALLSGPPGPKRHGHRGARCRLTAAWTWWRRRCAVSPLSYCPSGRVRSVSTRHRLGCVPSAFPRRPSGNPFCTIRLRGGLPVRYSGMDSTIRVVHSAGLSARRFPSAILRDGPYPSPLGHPAVLPTVRQRKGRVVRYCVRRTDFAAAS
jgi:hypothetical protein